MTAALVRSATGTSGGTSSTVAATLAGGAITAGNLLVAVVTLRAGTMVVTPTGWTYRGFAAVNPSDSGSILLEKVAVGGESLTLTVSKTGSHGAYLVLMEFSGAGAFLAFDTVTHFLSPADGSLATPTLAATDSNSLVVGAFVTSHTLYPYHGPPALSFTAGGGYTIVAQASYVDSTFEPALAVLYKATGAGNQAALATLNLQEHYGAWTAIYGTGGVAEPDPDPDEPAVEPVPPQGVLLEIYVAGAGTARWGTALWGAVAWSSAGWTDVTPEGIQIFASWGAPRPEDGILAETSADTWAIDTYDPDRLMDPGNPDATWAANLVPGLRVRFSHRGTVIREGVTESIGYDYAAQTGYIRVTNVISYMANALVPTDTILPNTLRARARTAIAAAGLVVTVEPNPDTGDPAVASKITDETSAWGHIADAALQVLHIPFVDRLNVLRFRAYAAPLERGRVLSAPELVELQAIRDLNSLYTTVRAFDGTNVVERSATPTPVWGARTYANRDSARTIDASDWCFAVLADRATSGLRWVPGRLRPLTADAVEDFATIETVELVAITHAWATPGISVGAIVLGGDITVTGKVNAEAIWDFAFRTAESPIAPLVEDLDGFTFLAADQDPTQYLLIG